MTVVSEIPEESCDISPTKICKNVNQLVPHLSPVEKCNDLPRQICSFGLKSPKISEKPLITKWCFDPEDDLNEDDELPPPPEFADLDNQLSDLVDTRPPDLSPIEVEDVLIFQDNNAQDENNKNLINESRNGKKFQIASDDQGVISHIDPLSSLNLGLQFPDRIDQKAFLSKNIVAKIAGNVDQPDIQNKHDGDDEDDVATINEIESINTIGSIESEGQNVNKQFKAILSKLSTDFRSKIKIEKADGDNDHKDAEALAKIIKHKNSPVSHTILIKNTPEAHKIFGIKNAPSTTSVNAGLESANGSSEILDFDTINENTQAQDLAFSDIDTAPPSNLPEQPRNFPAKIISKDNLINKNVIGIHVDNNSLSHSIYYDLNSQLQFLHEVTKLQDVQKKLPMNNSFGTI